MRRACLLTVGLTILLASAAVAQSRQEINLGGSWEFVKVKDLATGPPTAGWQPFTIPGVLGGIEYERAWFRRDFPIPAAMRGQQVVLHFGGVKWNSEIRVNGQQVGGHFGGYEPFDVDITAVAKVGETNRLEVGCCDWTGVFIDRETDFAVMKTRPTEPRDLPRDKILAPIGGLVSQYGIWDEVRLQSHPALFVKDVFVKPSVRQHRLVVEYTIANAGPAAATASLGAAVEEAGQTPLRLAPVTVTVPAGGETRATLEAPWPSPHLWSPADPHLYFLVTRLEQGGQAVDELRTRFGFREFWVEGSRFYLNGARINLLATSWWPELFKTKAYVQERLRRIKAAHCVAFRTHTQPWPEIWYETADEEGLLMIPEGAVWNDDDAYRINDPVFWRNYADHLRAMVDRDKNKPSVVMYSLENEFYGNRINNASPARKELARLGTLLKQWDPTRPIYYESDGDPEGVADVVGIHYPHEYPGFTQWPNTAYWMDEPLKASYFFVPEPEKTTDWTWDRKKPVYIGEFLWVPSSDPSYHTVFYGDEAYRDYELYRARAKGDSWRMAIQAYRQYEVGGISPWTMVEGGELDAARNPMYAAQQYAMQPVAAFVREYDHNFYGGATVARTVDIYNDVLTPVTLDLAWSLREGEKELASGRLPGLKLQPGERREATFNVPLPPVTARREVALHLALKRDGQEVFTDRKAWSVFPALKLTAAPGLGLYDPKGTTRAALGKLGLSPAAVPDLAAVPATVKALVIGARSLEAGEAKLPVIGGAGPASGALLDFVQRGGRVLVLEQDVYPTGVLPLGLTRQASTMTFAQMPDHPLLRDVRAEDLKWWRPDNRVSVAEMPRPTTGGCQAVVVSGSATGISYSPLLELRSGQGLLVMSQLLLAERLAQEPAAGLILRNALERLSSFRPAPGRTALFCPDPATREALDEIGLRATDLTADPSRADWANFDLLVACGPLAKLQPCLPQVQALVQRGGKVLLHDLRPAEYAAWQPLLGTDLQLMPGSGSVTRVPGSHPLAASFANEDLYWLGPQRAAFSWATRPRVQTMTSAVFGKSLAGKAVTEYPHGQMTLAGPYVSTKGDAAILPAGACTATVSITVPRDGDYLLGVVAGGSVAAGEWPAGTVSVDGQNLGGFACYRGEMETYTVSGKLTAGAHEVVIRFANDYQDVAAGEDRNLALKALLVAPDEPSPGVTFLTAPAAVAAFDRGAGQVVVDNVNWAQAPDNEEKARRYIAGLLTGMGAQFAPGAVGTVLEVSRFTPDPQCQWYRREATAAYLGSTGYLTSRIECARAGKYQFRFVAKGTPAVGVYPIIAVEVDGQPVGQVELKSDNWRGYPLPVTLTAGAHDLKLIFANDMWAPPEDRNLWISRIEVTAAE